MNSIPQTRASIKRLRNEGDEGDRKNEKRIKFANTPRTLRPRTLKTPATAKPKTATTTRTPRTLRPRTLKTPVTAKPKTATTTRTPRTLRPRTLKTPATVKPKTATTTRTPRTLKTPATVKPKTATTTRTPRTPKTPATVKPKTPQPTPRVNTPQPTPRAKRIGAGLSPRKMISPEVLYEFYLLVSEYREKKSYLGGQATSRLRQRFETYDKYLRSICELTKFKPTKNSRIVFKSYEPWLDLIRTEICASDTGNYTYPNQAENDSQVETLLSKCFVISFEQLFSKTFNKTGKINVDVYMKIQDEHIRLLSSIKDTDASSALKLYVIRNNQNQDLNTFLRTLNQSGESVKALKNMKNEYKLLFSKLRHKLTNRQANKINPIPLAVNHGPANHNTLSQSSMIRILKNPSVLDAFSQGSLFAYFINRAIDKHGTTHVGDNKCSLRGNIDECLLRRRVVFADMYSSLSKPGNKAAQTVMSAVNHGRMHRLKALPPHGNTKMPGNSVFKTFEKPGNVTRYINAMKSAIVRNSNLFKNGSNKLLQLQQGRNRTAVKYDSKQGKLVKFDTNMTENPHILWTTFGLHLNEKSKSYDFFDFIDYIYNKYNNGNTNIMNYIRNKTGMGSNYIIQLDSATLTYLHNEYYFKNTENKNYIKIVKDKLLTCRR
jgi:hypothetical protein